jgi:hypothetical protein
MLNSAIVSVNLKRQNRPIKTDKNIPVKPDQNPDPTQPKPGGNEPEKNDPTRIEEPNKADPTRIDEPPPARPETPGQYGYNLFLLYKNY